MAIDPRHLGILRSIAEHGSFSAAAVTLNTSQPALSNQIALLERTLGAKVFNRNRHGVTLTETGGLLFRHARAMDAVLAQAQDEVDLKKRGREGPLVIGVTPAAMIELVPRALASLTTSNISLSVADTLDETLQEKLQVGELDLVVGTLGFGTATSQIHAEPLIELSFGIMVGAASKLARRRMISLRELTGMQWALPPPGGAYRRYLEAIFLNNGVPFPVGAWTFNTSAALKAVVQYTDCVAIIPKHVAHVEEKAGVLRVLKLNDPSPSRPIGMMHLQTRPLSPVANRFREALREVAKTIR
jgi:DNA-binding transcriptional LysR family regulator